MFVYFLWLFITCLLYWILQKILDRTNDLPPGPLRLPFVGCMFQVLWLHPQLPFIAFQKLAKVYGDIMYVQLGVVRAVGSNLSSFMSENIIFMLFTIICKVVINGYKANKEILTSDDWIGRNQEKWQLDRTFGQSAYGLITADVETWKETRRFCIKSLREFGFGVKIKMEVHVAEEVKQFCQSIKQKIGNTEGILQVQHLFDIPVLNSSWTMISGKPFAQNDPKILELLKILDEFFKLFSLGGGLLTAYPFLVDIAPQLVKYKELRQANLKFQNFFQNTIAEARAEGNYKNNPSNFIEVFLQKIDEVQRNDPGNLIYCDKNLVSILYDFFLGATETTSNTLRFSILYLITNPIVQERVAAEVLQVIGKNRLPNMDDKPRMPYTQATILETFRMSSVVPVGPRRLHKDATYGPYKIPKGTTVFPNYWSITRDESIWTEPDLFRPERFLDEKLNIINEDKLMSFALGKRNCIGESVAKTTFFITLTGLLQQFKFEMNLDEPKPSATPELGISLSPKPFSFLVKLRE